MLPLKSLPAMFARPSLWKLGLIASLGLATANPAPLLASPAQRSDTHLPQECATSISASPCPRVTASAISSNLKANGNPIQSAVADGIYLYGQSAQPEQLGQEYLVFKVEGGQVAGVFYMPQSEYSCFSGTLKPQAMSLSIADPYENTAYPYSIPLQAPSAIAASEPVQAAIGLEGYQRIDTLSANDRRLLAICLEQVRR
jgi:hypothetical protein